MNPHPVRSCFLNRWRHPFGQWLQIVAVLSMSLLPPTNGGAYWTDTDSDTYNDTWTDPTTSTSTTLVDMNAVNADADSDGASNDEEAAEGSDPYLYDTDYDGLSDGDELHVVRLTMTASLTAWDSDGDFISDYDEWHGFYGVTYTNGQLPNFPNASYSDYDGDYVKNPDDLYPTDPTNNDGDGDGINDSIDPDTSSADNYSYTNNSPWYGDALGDADGDGIKNFYDQLPYDPSNGSHDLDADGILSAIDPFPFDHANYSETNSISWYGTVLGDDDGDGTLNYTDAWPYDFWNGEGTGDLDSDGITNALDPAPNDPDNYSAVNETAWYGNALEDLDQDGSINFNDPYPSDPFDNLPDFDSDGVLNAADPFPKDATNYSSVNGVNWHADVLGDIDEDTIANWEDTHPEDPYDGDPDVDADGIANGEDPFPRDASNFSSINGINWYQDVFEDADEDTIPNWQDAEPTTAADEDEDGLTDYLDPYPEDATNFSSVNNIAWGEDVLADLDADGTANYLDAWPDDYWNGEVPNTDLDEYRDDVDPVINSAANFSSYNDIEWFGQALSDADGDGAANWYDPLPYFNPNIDSDEDGILNLTDPYPNDATNYSSVNQTAWHANVLGDEDEDGTPNWQDSSPFPPPIDTDEDGLTLQQEQLYGTSDEDVDCDDDGLSDYEEKIIYDTDPLDAYSISRDLGWGELYGDSDLVDLTDTDSDGIPDGIEAHYGLDAENPADAAGDLDANGMSNLLQYQGGIALNADLDRYDADSDGMTDVFEDYYQLNKLSFADAVGDADGDGVMNYEEQQLALSPQNSDTLLNGALGDLLVLMKVALYPEGGAPTTDTDENDISDWADAALSGTSPVFTRVAPGDLDGDGLPDVWEHQHGRWKYPNLGLFIRFDDAADDADEDNLTNHHEYLVSTNPLIGDSDMDGTEDDEEDFDGDGLSNGQELLHGTSMTDTDSDDDGINDGDEVEEGSDPNSAASNSRSVGLELFIPLVQ